MFPGTAFSNILSLALSDKLAKMVAGTLPMTRMVLGSKLEKSNPEVVLSFIAPESCSLSPFDASRLSSRDRSRELNLSFCLLDTVVE